MKKFILCLLIVLSANNCAKAAEMAFSKMPVHYAREMEYFYLKPRPEIIPELINSFNKNGWLNKSENRLILSAFIAELFLRNSLAQKQLLKKLDLKEKNIAHTIAWALHLAQKPVPDDLFSDHDQTLKNQIQNSPAPLASLAVSQDNTILLMLWSAFFAGGNYDYLNKIINCALSGNTKIASAACATLYDYAPRHSEIITQLKKYLPDKTGPQHDIISTILDHAQKQ